jgi:hypothetical protein
MAEKKRCEVCRKELEEDNPMELCYHCISLIEETGIGSSTMYLKE